MRRYSILAPSAAGSAALLFLLAAGCAGRSAHIGKSAPAAASEVEASGITELVVSTPDGLYWLGPSAAADVMSRILVAVLAAPPASADRATADPISNGPLGPRAIVHLPFPGRRVEAQYHAGAVVLMRSIDTKPEMVRVLVAPAYRSRRHETLMFSRIVTADVESAWGQLEALTIEKRPRSIPSRWAQAPILLGYVRETFVDEGIRTSTPTH